MGKHKKNLSAGDARNAGSGAQVHEDLGGQQERDYKAAALYLAQSYGNMLKQKEYIDKVMSGKAVYTEDDALDELISTTASTESDTGIRVQSSNISNTTERIGLLLANGFVEKRNREIRQEVLKDTEGRQYLYWKIDVIETAMAERMDSMEQNIFRRLFVKHMTYKQVREAYHKKKLYNRFISDKRSSALELIAEEIRLRSAEPDETETEWLNRLFIEVREQEADDG